MFFYKLLKQSETSQIKDGVGEEYSLHQSSAVNTEPTGKRLDFSGGPWLEEYNKGSRPRALTTQ